jgi:predicted nucleic acid-binding protein
MALILDTNALSAFADGDPALRGAIEEETELAVPAIVLGEYLFGIRQSRLKRQYEGWLQQNASILPVLRVGPATAARYADIRSELKSAGKPIPTNDLWIAALAREHGCAVVSRDRHFEAVRGLNLIAW